MAAKALLTAGGTLSGKVMVILRLVKAAYTKLDKKPIIKAVNKPVAPTYFRAIAPH
ncbi:Uncharacterised protein [Chlamydia trachomatis]|nr:Uncharacterised protein [Chlamydia trachomatis]